MCRSNFPRDLNEEMVMVSGDEYCSLKEELETMMTLLPVEVKFWTESLASLSLRRLVHLWTTIDDCPPERYLFFPKKNLYHTCNLIIESKSRIHLLGTGSFPGAKHWNRSSICAGTGYLEKYKLARNP